eukprot:TRINITY_DN1167_c0_g1_i1.p1 TRINITY_DN1167_c0_g1~~TRINITY_DN1167_c0_g1_i1.p1  ORF type:complete len:242 (+),score=137.94 TRINITY_DN1167_c0_g1_i1:209-934(+)
MAPIHLFVSVLNGRTISISIERTEGLCCAQQIKEEICGLEGIPSEEQRILFNGREIHSNSLEAIENNSFLRLKLRLNGGKGGFGALLRGSKSGAKVTNFDDCRDLNGRRIRHVKNEQKLQEWYQQQAKEEAEKEKNKKKSKEWKPEITFDGNQYRKELEEIDEAIKQSVEAGLKNSMSKKKEEEKKEKPKKRSFAWGGMEDFNDSSSDEEENEKETKKKQKKEVKKKEEKVNSKEEKEDSN